MKSYLVLFLVSVLVGFAAGCSQGDSAMHAEPAPALLPDETPDLLEAGAPAEIEAPPPVDFEAARPMDDQGNPISDLELLNEALEQGQMRGTAEVGTYRDLAEEQAALQAAAARSKAIKHPSELVQAGVIKSAPVPPPGKEFVIDPRSGQFVLADKKP